MASVLIVDDEKNVLLTLSIGLRRYQYTVLQAQNGADALKIMKKSPCPFVVSDIRMTPMDGFTLAGEIRSRYPWVRIVFMSAYGSDILKEDKIKAHPYPRLTKPFEVGELVKVLREEEKRAGLRYILVLGRPGDWNDSHASFGKKGMIVTCVENQEQLRQALKAETFDGFIVDGHAAEPSPLPALNEIDRKAQNKPVVLLSKKAGKEDSLSAPELANTVLDRKKFFDEPQWAADRLKRMLS